MKTEASEYLSLLQEIQNNNVSTFTVMPADEPRFTIETNSRNIIVPSEFSFLSVQNDHRAETIYFEIDRYFDNVDLSQHACVVQFINKSGTTINEGTYPVTSMDIDSVDGKIVFGWEIRNDATQLTGDITFSVRFYSIDNNGNFTYNFNTLTASSYILPSLNIIASGERITATELEVWTDKMNNLASSIESDIITVEEKIEELENYIASIPEDYTALTEEVGKLSEEIDDILDGLSELYRTDKNINNLSLWEQGSFEASTGNSITNTTRIRTKNYISKQINEISADDGYQFLVYAWNGDSYVGFYQENGSFYPSGAYWVNYLDFDAVKLKKGRENYNYRLLLRKSDNSNLSIDDYSKIRLITKGSKKTVISGDVEQRPSIVYREGDDSAYTHGCMSEGLNNNNLRLLAMKYENDRDVVVNNRKATTHEVMNYIINKDNFKTNGRLYKDGTLLKNASGRTVKLNGIGLHNILQYNNLHTIDGFKSLMYMGINMIRITVYLYPDLHLWANTGGYKYYGYLGAIEEHDNRIDELVTMLTELGFYIILDWHILGSTMDEWYATESQSFWHKYASKYATQGNIIWELANEPSNTSDNFTEYASFIKTSRDIIRSYDPNAVCVAGALNLKPIGTYNAFKDIGIDDVFISQHYYTGSGTDGYDNTYCDFLVSGIPLFITEWGNAAEDGGNPPNNTASEEVFNFYDVSYVANSIWKFTDQDHLTSVLKNIGSHNSPLYFFGFSDGDLSYNGKFYFDNLREKMLDNPNTFDASTYLVNGKYITETGEIANSETGYVFANIPIEPKEKYHILLSGGKFIRCLLHNTNIMEHALEENNFVVSKHRDIVVESKDFKYITVCVTDIKSSSTSGWIRVEKE